MLLSRVAHIYSLIDQPDKLFELLSLLPAGDAVSDEAKQSHIGATCHSCNNGATTIKTDMLACVNPDCLRLGTAEMNYLDDYFFINTIAVCNSNEPGHTEDFKRQYVIRTMEDYNIAVKARTGRTVDILFQKKKKEEFEKFKARPTPSAAKELLKYYLPIGIAGYESLTPTEVEEEV